MAWLIRKAYKKSAFHTGAIHEETVNPMAMARCPDCEAEIEVAEDAMIGEILSCPDCGLELEIEKVEHEAVELQKLAIEKEDWGE